MQFFNVVDLLETNCGNIDTFLTKQYIPQRIGTLALLDYELPLTENKHLQQ